MLRKSREASVSAILEGSVQKIGWPRSCTGQLIRTRDGYHLWSQTFDREFKKIFEVAGRPFSPRRHSRVENEFSADDSSRKTWFRRYTTDP